MKRTMKKMLSFGLVAAMSLTMLAGVETVRMQQMIQMFQMDRRKKSRQEMSRLVFWFRMSVVRKH